MANTNGEESPASSSSSTSSSTSSSSSPASRSSDPSDSSYLSAFTSARSRRQLGLFVGGVSFFVLSSIVTRRSLARRYRATRPAFYQPSNRPSIGVNGAMEAVEALNIATINIASFSMMLAGGLCWAYDISSLDDLRHRVRAAMGVDSLAGRDADEEMEEWMASVLARKEEKDKLRRRRDRARGRGPDGDGDPELD